MFELNDLSADENMASMRELMNCSQNYDAMNILLGSSPAETT